MILIRDIVYAVASPFMRRMCVTHSPLIRNTRGKVAPKMFHQTISAILLRICSFLRTQHERRGITGQWNRGINLNIPE